MSEAHRRLRLVTEAAYATDDDLAGDGARSSDNATSTVDAQSGDDTPARDDATSGDGVLPVARPIQAEPEAAPGHRWGTPALMAARLGVFFLLLAVAAAVTIIVTRPSAPVHQPDLAWPDPPQEWGDDGGQAGDAAGSAGSQEPGGGSGEPGERGGTDVGADPSAAADHPQSSGADDGDPEHAEAPASTDRDAVVVHVAGQVNDPGIVELPGQARVHEALMAAGGPTSEADLAALNLAAPVGDGQQIYVPAHGEEPRSPPAGDPGSGPGGTGDDGTTTGTGGSDGAAVNINTADATTLQTLSGIGPAMAERILTHRDQHGPFAAVDDLMAVSGIGPATLTRLRDQVVV